MTQVVEVVTAPPVVVEVSVSAVQVVEVTGGVRGPVGPAGPDSVAAIAAHIAEPRPHVAAESGRDFAGWFNAQITT